MTITWLGHSCFRIQSGDTAVVFDPYEDNNVPGLAPLRLTADCVFCSHEHHDHNARENVSLTGRPRPVDVETIETWHDNVFGAKRGKNTIHILRTEGLTVAHLGDLGHMLSGKKLAALRGVDVLMLPIGGYYTMDAPMAAKLADETGARIVLPMHYRLNHMGYAEIAPLEDFTSLRSDVVYYDTNTLIVTPQTPKQTAVLSYVHG